MTCHQPVIWFYLLKLRFAKHKTKSASSNNTLLMIWLSHNKFMWLDEFMMFSIPGGLEEQISHTFETPDDNCTQTWFGTHVCRHMTRLFIFWYKKTFVKLFLNKLHCNINVFESGCKYLRFDKRNATYGINQIYCTGSSV